MLNAADRRLIFLLGTPRSGTTWLAAILNSYPGVVYSHEPLSRLQIPRLELLIESIKTSGTVLENEKQEILKEWSAAYTECRRPPFFPKSFQWSPASVQMLTWILVRLTGRGHGLFRYLFSPGKRRSFDVLVKDIDWSKHAEMLMRALDPMLVNIVRHPCAVASSLLRGQSLGLMPEHDRARWYDEQQLTCKELGFDASAVGGMEPAEFLGLEWLVQNLAYRRVAKSHPRNFLIVYEELCRDPICITQSVFEFLGWELGAQTLKFIKKSGKEQKVWLLDWLQAKHPYFGVRKDPIRSAESWRHKISQKQKEQILSVASLFPGFSELWPEPADLAGCHAQKATAASDTERIAPSLRASDKTTAVHDSALATPCVVPLVIESTAPLLPGTCQPITFGLPFPKGALLDLATLHLRDARGERRLLQTRTLSRWTDGSIRWALLDTLVTARNVADARWQLSIAPGMDDVHSEERLQIDKSTDLITINTGVASFFIQQSVLPFARIVVGDKDLIDPARSGLRFSDAEGRPVAVEVRQVFLEEKGPLRATVCAECISTRPRCNFTLRVSFFAGTGLVRLRLKVHNPCRARHRGGLWDLGDPGSIFFKEFAVELGLADADAPALKWRTEPGTALEATSAAGVEIYQDSSGGENWRCKNHMNRDGRIPCSFRGYRVREGGRETFGRRANPALALAGSSGSIAVAVPEFWEQFPKALSVADQGLRVGLFPGQFADLFELQGGESKTHTIWFEFSPARDLSPDSLAWVHHPLCVRAPAAWYVDAGVVPYLPSASDQPLTPLEGILKEVIDGDRSFFARREIIDEYGWRNYGEVYADHELAYYRGDLPLISHYNNQYDFVGGALLQFMRSGNSRWMNLADAMARHVIDIDIYHTRHDRSAYSDGLFWHTDHYLDASTCTHRSFSRHNCQYEGGSYGGGPSNEHNYTSGLLLYYYLTGERSALDAVVGLAEWVVNRDSGAMNPFGLVNGSPTGLATSTTQKSYHGPGRGAGNSVNALLDAWLATGRRFYLESAERLIRRVIHPADDIAARDLLSVELRWSYTVFLSVLARYLRIKEEMGAVDYMYAYAQASLVAYAQWMLDNERPYFDQVEKLQYPTETWAAQEMRKANVLRMAASHVDEPLRARLLERGKEFADRAWKDLLRFESRTCCRPVAILMIEGTRDIYFRSRAATVAPRLTKNYDFGSPERFVPQREQVLKLFKGRGGLTHAVLRAASPWNWWKANP